MVVNIVEEMTKLGFSDYEARAYVSLLEENPTTAYDTAKRSGIPSSKIYEVLARLESKNMVFEVYEGKKKLFVPAEVKEFISSYSRMTEESLHVIDRESRSLRDRQGISYIIHISAYEELMNRLFSIIKGAERSLLLSGWHEELSRCHELVRATRSRSAIVHFGRTQMDYGTMYEHPVEDILRSEKGGRQLVTTADEKEALSATIHSDGTVEGVWSRNSGFVRMVEDYIKHDIYILKAVEHLGEGMQKKFGSKYEYLRNIFSDEVM